MRINLLFCLITALFISGCATLSDSPSRTEIYRLKDRISILEEELGQKRKENIELRQEIAELERLVEEKTILRMPTGEEVQEALKNAGFYDGEIDGQVGLRTKMAIREFQEANGLNPDGVVGSRTWEILRKHLADSS
jgi:murein L,D-transpeptidase YcbB/YkuD